VRIIGKTPPDRAAMIACLLSLNLWDSMSTDERYAAVEKGEIWDTKSGRLFMQVVNAVPKRLES